MGVNAVLVCERHRVQTYMMRGEEFFDLQRWMREDHTGCFADGRVRIFRDCDEYLDYPEAWPHDARPAALIRIRFTPIEGTPA